MMKTLIVGASLLLATALARGADTPWQAVTLTASAGGWFEVRGLAKGKPDLTEIAVTDGSGRLRETYAGRLEGSVWRGRRTVMNSDNVDEPLTGKLAKRKIDGREYQTLILSNKWTSANFIRILKTPSP